MASAPFLQDEARHQQKAAINSLTAGALFGFGWILFVDSVAHTALWKRDGWNEVFILASPLIASTLCLFLLNIGLGEVDDLRESLYAYNSGQGLFRARSWVGICAVGGSLAAMASVFLLIRTHTHGDPSGTVVAGSGSTGTLFIIVSGIMFWVGKGHAISSV